MSYCSIEEAWGDSFEQSHKENIYNEYKGHEYSRDTSILNNHNGSKNRVDIQPIEIDEEYTGQFSNNITDHDFKDVMATTEYNSQKEVSVEKYEIPKESKKSFGSVSTPSEGSWKDVSDKLEKLIILLTKSHSKKESSWPDMIIYFLTGFFSILILWCFFAIGKWIGSKSLF